MKKPAHRHALLKDEKPRKREKASRVAKKREMPRSTKGMSKRMRKNLRIVSKVVDEPNEDTEATTGEESETEKRGPTHKMQFTSDFSDLSSAVLSKMKDMHTQRVAKNIVTDKEISKLPSEKSYAYLGDQLASYTHGKLPREVTYLVRESNWHERLMETRPLDWSPHAFSEITNHFVSNLNQKELPSYHLNFHLPLFLHFTTSRKQESKKLLHPSRYKALQKSLFKPNAFTDGFLVPLCKDCNVNSRQALVIAGLIQSHKFPCESATRALNILTKLPYTPALAILLRCFIEKKFQFSNDAINTLAEYFLQFLSVDEKMPVLWNQLLLSFVTVFSTKLTDAQKYYLHKVASKHQHEGMTGQILSTLK